ncbi:uncharacterized protein LOC131158074 isoform X1 [Malania oleifera]|uniref:uncharacterized protein LOC131158074 isoform X1 n=1 Tax=Malania oleifera TaxID=397392 RepID=UPI0025AE2274|nr:uncharacterized protein LOC131158074 isoform X1 [Malania oleifera]
MADDGKPLKPRRSPLKTLQIYNAPNWKRKLRENCYKRIREDRTHLLWKMRSPADQSFNKKEFIQYTFQDIVSDELRKIQDSSPSGFLDISTSTAKDYDKLWEYDGVHSAYQGECEEIILEMQKIFYEDLRAEATRTEKESHIGTWEDEEDEYLARAVYEHMHLNNEQACKEFWCPICKKGELQENHHLIYCTHCELQLNKADEVNLDILGVRLAEAHEEHLDRGCRFKPVFCIETIFDLTALYIQCDNCNTFEIVI